MNNISWQDIRKVILDFLQQRLANNSNYKSETAKLEKAKELGDQVAVNEAQQKLAELAKRFDFETWMEDAAIRRISWLLIATHIAKGVHPSSKACNANYNTQIKPNNLNNLVSSATVNTLPFDASGAAALDIFGFLNQVVKNDITILQLIINNHPAVQEALSDDKNKSALYLENFKQLLKDNWSDAQASELNKQFFWPNSEETYLSQHENNYRLLIPLHPSALCHLVYQKVQTRFSEENKNARELRRKKDVEHQPYISFHDLAVVKLGGSNAQNASQLIGSQMGRNFLLPSMPPKFQESQFPSISKHQKTIFNNTLQYFCRFGFKLLFDMVKAPKNIVEERDDRKDAFAVILSLLLKFARHIQTTQPAGWSRDYSLNFNEKLWLDPQRAQLENEEDFKKQYEQGDWQQSLEKLFATWVQTILKEKFKNIKQQFADPEFSEWRREFRSAVKASQRKREGIF
ncbi:MULTISPECIES: type I-F CRISPR-associated protein Csy1 [unclassified Gilliamella]|uniref:type I-F CRISPR-associated protein Csy1 n=1 Tax=unclassified Gilliamella TaxID=2685620 RepID=UPI0013059312|nr:MULTISPECIES: type I-F CRISPR-associated protein Csy1 [unclassified Gilliamella]MWP48992.1 type I-F CRISPR-associated protein Csy1 [Gilliamella sp. Lep-s35]MWP69079.1 type I-F CRISPR-associated protein Csy1 [Gilliamella sp. Lep-s5]MWP77258.1 type I-F CRISPR-associated protein Csy1 [Gilliamella sp. Lep-s21]